MRNALATLLLLVSASAADALQLHAAVLPSSRSVQVAQPATVFATVINAGETPALGCAVLPAAAVPATLHYQATDPATNQPIGTLDTPVDIPARGSQSFILILTPTAEFQSTPVAFTFDCTNTDPAPSLLDVNTLRLSAGGPPIDVIAVAVTLSGDGIVHAPPSGFTAFSVAATNIGTSQLFLGQVSVITSSPVTVTVCETDPTTGVCFTAGSAIQSLPPGGIATFSVFVQRSGSKPFDAGKDRIVVQFLSRVSPVSASSVLVGSTSIAVNAQ